MRSSRIRILQLLLILTLLILIMVLINGVGIERMRARVEEFGIWAPLAVFVLRLISVVLPAIPGTVYSVLSGSLFGFVQGLILISVADLLSCTLNFWIARRFGRNVVERFVGQSFMVRIDRLGQRHLENNLFLMIGFLMTGLFDFVSYTIGLTQTKWQKFMGALILGILLSNPPVVALGSGLFEGGRVLLGFALLGIFALAIVTGFLNRKQPVAEVSGSDPTRPEPETE